MSDQKGHVKSEVRNGIGVITFFHPQSNSLPGAVLRELAAAISHAGNDDAVKVILLKSEGEKAFCAGASFDELVSINDKESGTYFFSGFAMVINAIRLVPKFVIARVQGKAVGGGVGIAAAADYTFALETASVKLSELAVGIGPFVVGPAVERKVGTAAFSAMTINATQWHSAQWAHQCGLYASLSADANQMDNSIDQLCHQLVSSNPEAMSELKKIFWKGCEDWEALLNERAAISGQLVLSDFTKNAIAKFKAQIK
ncbi:MAG TPA: enoyl-CoA hydratase/isomerase family protein [Bacteroidia bacterium]|nr:enoyl-CoA hydratase/isomerase family protein [Bacteroidia bacterium]HNT79501.1 enoyl-CoA hydratase/isomerase family protein [Bacteroidia bacterium]